MTAYQTHAQLVMLAETLHADAGELTSLERLGPGGLRALREAVSDRLFDEQAAMFARISKLAPLVPNVVVAKVTELVIPPLVAGRAAGALGVDHPGRIEDLLSRLSPRYMADCAPHLDPRAIAVLAPRVSGDVLVPAAVELMRRREYVTAARFVEFATAELIEAFERGIDDDLGLLHTASLTYSDDVLAAVIAAMPEERLDRIVRESLGRHDSIRAGLSVLSRLPLPQRGRLGEMLVRHIDADNRRELLEVVTNAEMLGELLDLAAAMSPEACAVLAAEPSLADEGVLRAVFDAAEGDELRQQAVAKLRAGLTPAAGTLAEQLLQRS